MLCIPPQQNAAFVAAMEDVLDLYSLPFDEKIPLVCMDEQPIELHADSREPIPLSGNNHTKKVDHEYIRKGTCCGFMFNQPLGGWRRIDILETRKKNDWAHQIKKLVDEDFPDAEKVILVCDNLNTHNSSSLYQEFPPKEAKRILDKLEIHHTPKHGSWLDMAEVELSVFFKQCLDRRFSTIEELRTEAKVWYSKRNSLVKTIKWQFSLDDARIKLQHLYPVTELNV